MNSLKKFVSTFVALTTIVWSMGGALLFPGIAQAATLSPGDLIKASGPAVYYYAADGKRYVFPNEKTYFSWFSDFSSVKTITDSELAAILIGGNVTIRPGTKLVKIQTDPKVYAISDRCGTLHWIGSEKVATTLYGSNWAQRVIDVPDAFFVDYQVGSSISSAVHPDGTIVKYASEPGVYYVVMNGQKRKLTGSSITDNRLNTANAIETTVTYSNGADVTGAESALKDVSCATASTPVATGSVSVALASDTPAGRTVPKNSSSNSLIKVNLTAGSQAAQVTGLRFKRVGAGAAGDFANVYLYDSNLTRLTSGRTINSSTHVVEFNSLSISIPANTTVPVYVYGDFSASSSGGEHAMQIPDAASVVISGSGTVTGNFPITGNTFVVGNVSAARVDVQKGVTPSNPTIGAKNVEVSNFKITANTNDVQLRQINLYQAGNIANTDVTNFSLVQGTTVVATASAVSSKNLITLVFNPPFVIANGVTKVFSLRADVGGRSGRTIRTYVEYTTDVTAIDQVYNTGAAVCIASTATGGCTAASQGSFDGSSTGTNYVEVTTQGGQLTVAFNGPTAANLAKGTLGIKLFDFSMTSAAGDLEIRNLDFSLAGNSSGNAKVKGSSGTEYFRNFKVVDADTGATVMGPIGMPSSVASPATTTGNVQFTDSWTLKANTTRNLRIVADLANSEDALNEFFSTGQSQYTVTLAAWGSNDVRITETGEFLATSKIVPSSAITGNPMTVKTASLTVGLASDPGSATVVKKQQNVPTVGISLAAGQQSDVTVTSIKLTGMAQTALASGYTGAKFDNLVTQIALYDGNTKLGDAQVPSSGVATITNFQLQIPKGTTKTLTVKTTVASTVSSATSTDDFAVGIAANADVTAQDQDANTVTASVSSDLVNNGAASSQLVIQHVRNSGTVTIQPDSQPQSTILVGNSSAWRVMGRYKATAQYEDGIIDRIRVQHPNDGGVNGDFAMVAVSANGDTTNRIAVLDAGTTGSKDIDLSANKITVPKDGSVSFELWAKIASPVSTSTAGTYSPRTGNTMSLGLATSTVTGEWDSNYTNQINVRTVGQASGSYLYSTSTNSLVSNVMVLRKGKPVVTKLTPSALTLTSGAPAELYKFQVAPDADGGNIAWKQIIFKVATSSATGSVTLNSFELYKGSQKLSTTAGSEEVYIRRSSDGADITGTTNSLTSGYVIVRLINEESVSGSGSVYTLRATPTFTGTGSSVSTSILASTTVVTGYIIDGLGTDAVITYAGALSIDSSAGGASSTAGTTIYPGTFLWTDNTDVPHSSASGTSGGSRDWTNGTYVSDLTQTQALTQ